MLAIDSILKIMTTLGLLERAPDAAILSSSQTQPISTICRLNRLDEETVVKKIAEALKIDFYDLADTKLIQSFPIVELIAKFDTRIAWKHKIIPLTQKDKNLVVAFANPLDQDIVNQVQFLMAQPLKVVIAEEEKIIKLLTKFAPQSSDMQFSAYESRESVDVEILIGSEGTDQKDFDASHKSPVVKICNKIIYDAVNANASDIHLEPTFNGLDVRFRIDGILHNILEVPKKLQANVISRFKIISGMNIAERRRPQDGKVRLRIEKEIVNLRVSTIPASDGEKLVLRLLRMDEKNRTFPQLGFPSAIAQSIRTILDCRGRMLLVTGPTGSGKSTSLYGFLEYLKDGTTNIETVEDPIEYRISGISQVQVNASVGVTFASALRSILRQDPDVIMIGEIRDKETADIAFQAAQTGHLVLSTLHTNDAPSAVTRLMNLELEPYIIASSLAGVLAQRLVRTLCPYCAVEAGQSYIEKHKAIIEENKIDPKVLKQAKGCASCNHVGYRGRTPIYSYMEVNNEIAELINARASLPEVLAAAKKSGFVKLHDAAINQILLGATTFDEVKSHLSTDEGYEVTQKKGAEPAAPLPAKNDSAWIVPGGQQEVMPQQSHAQQPQMQQPQYPQYAPPAPPQQVPQYYQPQPQMQAPSQPVSIKPKILIIEDSPPLRDLFAAIFKAEMYDVTVAADGHQGLQMTYDTQPDVILCDLLMPVMTGKEFVQRVRSNKYFKKIPIIILTASNTEENEIDLLEFGATDFICKSSSQKIMLSRVRKVLSSD